MLFNFLIQVSQLLSHHKIQTPHFPFIVTQIVRNQFTLCLYFLYSQVTRQIYYPDFLVLQPRLLPDDFLQFAWPVCCVRKNESAPRPNYFKTQKLHCKQRRDKPVCNMREHKYSRKNTKYRIKAVVN